VHPSNFRIEGFTERPSLDDLVALGARFKIPVIEDLGSGLIAGDVAALRDEPRVTDSIRTGAAVVMFSGDKLLGGPQAGIIAGRRDRLEVIRRHPLMRAFRVDKMTYAALEATLLSYATGRPEEIPAVRMMALSAEAIGARAERLATKLREGRLKTTVVDGVSTIGGGSAPGSTLPTRLVQLSHPSFNADALAERLRSLTPPIVVRIEDGCVVLDLRTVDPGQDESLAAILRQL
jgi:L-seryl-tRNA(Ser) seleniumtransferase